MQIYWIRCYTYDDARDFQGVIYLHEWNERPFYWGICNRSVFGGNPRAIQGVRRSPRYSSSYRHWIEGCLRHGGALYIGIPSDTEGLSLKDIEGILIAKYPSEMNEDNDATVLVPEICHAGDIPPSIRAGGA